MILKNAKIADVSENDAKIKLESETLSGDGMERILDYVEQRIHGNPERCRLAMERDKTVLGAWEAVVDAARKRFEDGGKKPEAVVFTDDEVHKIVDDYFGFSSVADGKPTKGEKVDFFDLMM